VSDIIFKVSMEVINGDNKAKQTASVEIPYTNDAYTLSNVKEILDRMSDDVRAHLERPSKVDDFTNPVQTPQEQERQSRPESRPPVQEYHGQPPTDPQSIDPPEGANKSTCNINKADGMICDADIWWKKIDGRNTALNRDSTQHSHCNRDHCKQLIKWVDSKPRNLDDSPHRCQS